MSQALPILTQEEVRVLGALIEKSQSTPEYYPMTLNALVNACNQKSSRDPVVSYDEDIVEDTLTELRGKGLVAFASGTGRTLKYMHRAGQNGLGLSPAQATALSILMLRGPQTTGEIRARAGKQFNFPTMEVAQQTVDSLLQHDQPYIEESPRAIGQKEIRYRHKFYIYEDSTESDDTMQEAGHSLRKDIAGIKETLRLLQKEMNNLRNIVTGLQGDVMVMKEDLYPEEKSNE
ncbi:MAG: YceH family protein [Bacteroidetes bacterium]|nr:YceH family protein [Bacteroidota bacterium]